MDGMANTLETNKGHLAKLLAQENIRVVFEVVEQPSFDLSNRTLHLPVWQELSADLLDLMVGHEIGHALFTPSDGWYLINEKYTDGNHAIQILEDARIEKKVKRMYPGLVKSFYSGYTKLVERNYFGLSLELMHRLPFLDRLNVYCKLGQRANVSFTSEEQKLVNRAEALETWEDVELLLPDILEASRKDYAKFGTPSKLSSKTSEINEDDVVEGMLSHESDKLPDVVEEWVKEMKRIVPFKKWDRIPSITIRSADAVKAAMLNRNMLPVEYIALPKLDMKEYVVPANIVHRAFREELSPEDIKRSQPSYRVFKEEHRPYITHLVKEFEARRAAKRFARTYVDDTGELDGERIWKYRLTDDIFRKQNIVSDDKNHGMFMLVDFSYSMKPNMIGTIEQMLALVLFCRQVGIPFDVYAFIDNYEWKRELLLCGVAVERGRIKRTLDTRPNTLRINDQSFRLKQLLVHTMNAHDFTQAIQHLLFMANVPRITSSMYTRGTPFSEALIVAKDVVSQFRKATRCDIVTTIILTDGDGGSSLGYVDAKGDSRSFKYYYASYVFENTQTKHTAVVKNINPHGIQTALLQLFQQDTDCRIVGFHLMNRKNYKRIARNYATRSRTFSTSEFDKEFRKTFLPHRYFAFPYDGYQTFYMLPGPELQLEDFSLDDVLGTSYTPQDVAREFKKLQKKRQVSYSFIRHFVHQIA